MNNKRKVKPAFDPRLYEFAVPGKRVTLTPGTEVSLRGKRGRFRFQYAEAQTEVRPPVLTFVGGPLNGQGEKFVSAYPDRVARIHRVGRTLNSIQKEKASGY